MTYLPPAIAEEHQRLAADLDRRDADNAAKRAAALRVIAECDEVDKDISARRATLADLESMYSALYSDRKGDAAAVSAPSASPISQLFRPPQRRARIGTQRYLMLRALHDHGPLDISGISIASRYSHRRVKEQMSADEKTGIVHFRDKAIGIGKTDATYELTEDGRALLTRFIAYRTDNGIPLPTYEDDIPPEDLAGPVAVDPLS